MIQHMSRKLCIAVIAIILSVVFPTDAFPQAERSMTVRGRVLSGSEPLSGATVTITGSKRDTAETKADGGFEFRDVPLGRFVLYASKPGFSSTPPRLRVFRPDSVTFPLVTLSLDREAAIGGAVRNEARQPLSEITVNIFREGFQFGRKTLTYIGSSKTNRDGQYLVSGLDSGKYYIQAAPSAARPQIQALPPAPPEAAAKEEPPHYRLTRAFFPSVANLDAAIPVHVASGESRQGTNLTISEVDTYCARGSLTVPREAAGRTLTVFLEEASSLFQVDGTMAIGRVASGERISICGLPNGSYRVYVAATDERNNVMAFGWENILIAKRHLEFKSIALHKPRFITGTIQLPGEASQQSKPTVNISLWQIQRPAFPNEGGSIVAKTDAPFTIGPLANDAYVLRLRTDQKGTRVVEWRCDGVTVRNTLPGTCGEMTIFVGVDSPELSGMVEGASIAEKSLSVLLVREGGESEGVQQIPVALDGSFRMDANLAGGEYYVLAVAGDVEADDPSTLAAVKARGQRISLKERQRTFVRLAVAAR